MHKIKEKFQNNKKYFIGGLVLVLAILYFTLGGNSTKAEFYTVKKADVSQSMVLSGKVQTSDRADLGFASSGRVANIFVKNNQSVKAGAILAQLEIDDLLADLKIKKANSRTSDVSLEGASQDLEKVTLEENTKVESAYRTLLSDGLELIPSSNTYTVDAPVVSGIYDGSEGRYKIIIDKKSTTGSDFEITTFDLEKTTNTIKEEGSTALGSRGLFISFPDADLSEYEDTIWYLDIPNKASTEYLSNYNAYNEAKKRRDSAIKSAEYAYNELLSENDSFEGSVAEAEIQKINAEIRKNTIYAPFDGKVTNIEKEVGENSSTGERVITILGENKLEIVLQVSELDVSKISDNAPIELTFDAFPNESFFGTMKTINSRETTIDGVPVYEAFVELASDERVKTGMSASGTIVLVSKDDVLAIPSYLIEKSGDVNTVEVSIGENKTEKREIILGLVGTDSMVEVISGLNEGESVLFTPVQK